MQRRSTLALGLLLTASAALAGPDSSSTPPPRKPLPDLTQMRPQNDINPAVAAEFWNKWHVVNVRYRQDNGEQRFIYANDLAWETIKAGKTEFPNGSMLGKVAFATVKDPAFPNSLEPERYTRVQLMLKDSKKYKDTNGWGYALYVPETVQKPEEDAGVQLACHACHKLVPQRDYVFSKPAFLATTKWDDPGAPQFVDKFKPTAAKDLAAFSQKVLETFKVTNSTVQFYSMPVFTGSLEESVGPLTTAASDKGMPFMLADDKDRRFIVAVPTEAPNCPKAVLVYLNAYRNNVKTLPLLKSGRSCNGSVNWNKLQPLPEALR